MACEHKKTRSVSDGNTLTYSCLDCGAMLKTIDTSNGGLKKQIAPKPFLLPLKKVEDILPMKNGEIRKLPVANSPMWTEQWAVQGSEAKPYVVSRAIGAKAKVSQNEWACSCKNWTSTSPRVECKHILNVIVKEKMTIPANQAMDEKTAKEFAAFQKARAKKELGIAEDWGISTGRKFR